MSRTLPDPIGRPDPAPAGRRSLLVLFAIVAVVLAAGMGARYAIDLHGTLPFPQDGAGYILGRDFLNTWFFGKAAFLDGPGRFYDHDLYLAWIGEVVPHDRFDHVWSYPPTFLLLAAPFGLLPYPVALAGWTALGLLALYSALRGDALRIVAVLLSPAALFCIFGGQVSLLIAAAMLSALRLLDRRPVLAGLLIALCTVKPQVGLLVPVLLVASGRWTTLASATLGTLALMLATCLVWGVDVWRDYVTFGIPAQIADMRSAVHILTPWSPTVTTALVEAGATYTTASAVQFGFTLLAAAIVAFGCAKGPMDARRSVLFLASSVVASPYLLSHDLVALSGACAILAAAGPLRPGEERAVTGLFLLPVLQMAAGLAHLPGVALVPIVAIAVLMRPSMWEARATWAPAAAAPVSSAHRAGG